MKKIIAILLTGVMCLSLAACGDKNVSQDTTTDQKTDNVTEESTTQEVSIPNNGEWDEILCFGDGYYLVIKTIDTYNEYNIMLGVVDQSGNWVQELTENGDFVEGVQFRALGSSKTLDDSSCYMYLGEGVFLASPGASVYSNDEEYRIGPWSNGVSYSPTGLAKVSIWECLVWNVIDNTQKKFSASKLSMFRDGYLLFCKEDELGGGVLSALSKNGEITELPCKYLPNKPAHYFPIYSEGLFYACSDKSPFNPGFYDVKGNRVIDLSEYDMGRIGYSLSQKVNAPYFENGQATILFKNVGDTVYKAIIDKTGAFVGDPQKEQGAITY